ncbi:hypothetical protein [Paraburkholderia dinghuensis]|uniref:Uncharacterized protein n=1 Tax=Paraburkholderia dinghuensis TaxID=2305225 RepID=A0A3N6MRD0_9BURK|nr:hypothetical protein [Paraburkholderia dinghuensis]RQH06514.1 hypothetical protein D1Y85_11580 [Paraburkholderia dinghuensis]
MKNKKSLERKAMRGTNAELVRIRKKVPETALRIGSIGIRDGKICRKYSIKNASFRSIHLEIFLCLAG